VCLSISAELRSSTIVMNILTYVTFISCWKPIENCLVTSTRWLNNNSHLPFQFSRSSSHRIRNIRGFLQRKVLGMQQQNVRCRIEFLMAFDMVKSLSNLYEGNPLNLLCNMVIAKDERNLKMISTGLNKLRNHPHKSQW
jgi:hypothetical protein